MLYTDLQYDFVTINNSNMYTPDIECTWLCLKLTKTKPTYICYLYRPPDGKVSNCLSALQETYDKIVERPDVDVLFLGDMNIDMLKPSTSLNALNKFLKNHNLVQIIDKPSRISVNTSTLLDHIYVNNKYLYHHQGTVEPGLSDHALVFTSRKALKKNRSKKTVFIRNMRTWMWIFSQGIFVANHGHRYMKLAMLTKQLTTSTVILWN